jgi:hypothetical protein
MKETAIVSEGLGEEELSPVGHFGFACLKPNLSPVLCRPDRFEPGSWEGHCQHVQFTISTCGPHSISFTALTDAGRISRRCSRSSGVPRKWHSAARIASA